MGTETIDFLDALYGNAEGWVTVSGINGTGAWKDGVKSARIGADLSLVLCDGEQECWFRVQPQASQQGRGEANTSGVVALIADFDFPGSSDNKKLAPFIDLDDVARFCKTHVPVKVSAVVSSGHGAHAYWFLEEPLDPAEGKELFVRFDLYLRERAKKEGKQLDPMQDLARVLRMPGSINAKDPDALVPVYSFDLDRTSDGRTQDNLGSHDGADKGSTQIYAVPSGTYYVSVITGPSPSCPWTVTITD